MLKIIDNALNDSLLISIKKRIEAAGMPWYFLGDSAYDPDAGLTTHGVEAHLYSNLLNYSFYHMVVDKMKGNEHANLSSPIYNMTNSIGLILKDSFELEKTYNVFRLRWGMTTTLNKIYKNSPHTDMLTPHKVILFYLNDSDGDTYFYDKEHKIIDSVHQKKIERYYLMV